jgi:uncharacterized coiled-coil protein SlyX
MRRAKREVQGSLDSLLDTMTNVVGILVILLVITQLGVSGAIKRIRGIDIDLIEVSPQDVAKVRDKAAQLQAALDKLRDRVGPAEERIAAAPARLEDVDVLIARLNRALNDPTIATLNVEQARQNVEPLRQQVKSMRRQLADVDQKIAALQAQLEAVPKPPAPPPKVVHLPDPRPAPKGTQPVFFLCRGGRVIHVPIEGLTRLAQSHVMKAFAGRFDPNKVDCDRLVEYFERENAGNRNFQMKVYVSNYKPYLELRLREDAGETIDAISHASSEFQREVRRARPDEAYARFLVWGDGFEAYTAARQIADERGLPAGWVPFAPNQEWRVTFAIDMTCADKPPPPPPPPPAPAPPKPAVPIPKPPERRPLPPDQID